MATKKVIGKAVMVRYVENTAPRVIYTRCCNEIFARAEILMQLEELDPTINTILGIYDLDPSFSEKEFQKSYKEDRLERFLEIVDGLEKAPKALWKFEEQELSPIKDFIRPGYAFICVNLKKLKYKDIQKLAASDRREFEKFSKSG